MRWWVDPWRDRPVLIRSPLTVPDAIARLHSARAVRSTAGDIPGSQMRFRPQRHNASVRRLYGRLDVRPTGGCELVGEFRASRSVLWAAAVVLVLLVIQEVMSFDPVQTIAGLGAVLLFFLGASALSAVVFRNDEQYEAQACAELAEILDGEVIEPVSRSGEAAPPTGGR